jgi:Ca-activated chloride channel family protein
VNCAVELDRDLLPAGQALTAVIKVSLETSSVVDHRERPPVNLVLVLDRSGSMTGNKIAKAREAAIEALYRLNARDRFALVAYDHRVETLIPPQSAANKEWIEARIRQIRPGGNTALFGAVSQGAAEIRKNLGGGYIHRIILLSDGLANVGPSSPSDLGRLGAALLKEGISVTTVGVGTDYNEDLMAQLADRSDGNHYFVAESRDLPRIFASELGDVLSTVARRVIIDIECPDGVRPLRIIGRDGRIHGNRVELRMNQLYGGQSKFALVEVEIPAGRPDQVVDLARVRCRYENALTSRQEQSKTRVAARYSGDIGQVRKAVRPDIQKDVVANEMAEARDKALDLYNAGRKDEAVQELQKRQQLIEEKSQALGMPALAAPAESLADEAAEFEEDALDSTRKKEIRSESYRVRKQQKEY